MCRGRVAKEAVARRPLSFCGLSLLKVLLEVTPRKWKSPLRRIDRPYPWKPHFKLETGHFKLATGRFKHETGDFKLRTGRPVLRLVVSCLKWVLSNLKRLTSSLKWTI